MSFAKIEPRQRGLSFFSFLFDKKKKKKEGGDTKEYKGNNF